MKTDLRSWLTDVEAHSELKTVDGADWNKEIGTVVELNAKARGPALLFDKIKDYPAGFRLLAGAMSSAKRLSLTLGMPLDVEGLDLIRSMLTKIGLDPRSDAQILPLSGGSGVRLAALLSGNIDATLISYTQEKQAEKLGLTIIPIPMQYIQGQISTRRSYLEKNPKMVKAFLLSLSETIRAVRADRGGAMSVIARVLKTDDKAVLEHAYDALRSQVVPDLLPTEESIVNVLRIMSYEDAAFASIAPFKHFDLSLVQEIAAEQARIR